MDDQSPLVSQSNVLPFLEACASLAPTYLSLGNHEWLLDGEDMKEIEKTGVKVLDNSWVTTSVDDKHIALAGLTSAYVTDYRRFVATLQPSERAGIRYPKKDSISGVGGLRTASEHIPETAWLADFSSSPAEYRICLSHHPEYITLIPASIELILSGHCHGGQWRYWSPRTKKMEGVFAPGQGFFPKYSKGVHNNRLVISAGLSNTARVPRICNPTEVVYIEPGE